MNDQRLYELMELLPEELLDEDLQFHMQRAAEPGKARRSSRIAAFFRRRKPAVPNEIDDLMRDAVRHDAPKRTAAQDAKIIIPEWMEEETMKAEKHARKLNKAALVLIAALILAVGGTVAAVGYSLHQHQQNSETELESEVFEDDTPPDTEHAIISPKLTNQTDTPDCHKYAETDGGFFYLKTVDALNPYKKTGVGTANPYDNGLVYADLASGESVFVCAKPNCQHDGSEYCTATTKNYSILCDPVWLDGYVYTLALDNRELLKNPENCTKFPTVLLRYAPDGTEVTEAAQLYLSANRYHAEAELIAHRGQLWITVGYGESHELMDANMLIFNQDNYGVWEMYCYEPEPKKLTTLLTSGEPQKGYGGYRAPQIGGYLHPAGSDLKGVGNYVYFHKVTTDWRDPLKGAGVFRIDCRTGLTEQVVKLKTEKSRLYSVCGDCVYYSLACSNMYNGVSVDEEIIHAYDLKTGADTELVSVLDLAMQQASWLKPEMTYSTYREEAQVELGTLMADRDRCYLSWTLRDNRVDMHFSQNTYLSEIGRGGMVLGTVDSSDAKNMELPEEWIRKYIGIYGWWGQKRAWISPEEMTEEDVMFMRSNGYSETEDGEMVDPRTIKNEDEERLRSTGFYSYKFFRYEPEEITEEIIQEALKDFDKDMLVLDTVTFDGTCFNIRGYYAFYRMTPEETFGEMRPERLFYYEE
ncbi:MAG: hypothetical protein IK134_08575 [Oscillospiraceae bacterium]|nr:hypothetical protein [Oscillospiraceae bacterium]